MSKRTSILRRAQVLLHPDFHSRLKLYATKHNLNIGEIIDDLVAKFLRKNKENLDHTD